MGELSAVQIQKFTTLFNAYDFSQNNYLTRDDFLTFARRVSEAFGWAQQDPAIWETRLAALEHSCEYSFNRLLNAADRNHDHQISLPEYLDYFKRQAMECKNMGRAAPWIKDTCKQIDLLFDVDASGSISADEYAQMLAVMGSDADAASVFATFDLDGDGKLMREDIERLLLEFIGSDDPQAPGNRFFCGK